MNKSDNGVSKTKQRKLSDNGFVHGVMIDTQESDIFSQETVPYSPELAALTDFDDGLDCHEKTDFDGGVDCHEKTSLSKLRSVLEDAKFIADILSYVEVNDIYDRLKTIRTNPNRIEVITNELLERQSPCKNGNSQQRLSSESAGLMKDFVKIIDLTTSNMPALPVSAEEIQELLNAVRLRSDRVDFVFSQILGLYCLQRQGHGDLVKDMKTVLVQCPSVTFEEVSKLMIKEKENPNRLQSTLDNVIPNIAILRKTESSASHVSLNDDLVYRDTRIISKVLPEVDRNEIYAYLEAHHHEKNRIRIVIDELMKFHSADESLESSNPVTLKPYKGITCIQDEVDEIRQIFPDCDPNYVFDQLEQQAVDKKRMKTVVMAMFENKSYPKLKEREELEKKTLARNRIKNLTFDLEEFLVKFSDPVKVFENDDRKMNQNYKNHVEIQIRNDFPQLKGKYLKKVMENHGYHFTSCRKEIQADIAYDQLRGRTKKIKAKARTLQVTLPEEPDEFFYYEQLYNENELLIKNHLEENERLLQLRRTEAKDKGELFVCDCCFDDECIFEEMSTCSDGHLFCKECIQRSSEVVIGDGKTKFPCLLDSCKEEFPLSVLQSILPANIFSILVRRLQEEEIKLADIPDLVSCPFCSFATIMPEEDRIFKCLNPECLKESCRLCKEPSHVPLRCEEVEKQRETSMRTFIETKLSEAMLRTCHQCNKRFMKEIGCNKMTCVCGASMCYVCREPDINYDHFTGNNCSEGDMKELHLREMREAALSAKEQYIEEHPECSQMDLKFDPIKLVEECNVSLFCTQQTTSWVILKFGTYIKPLLFLDLG